MTVDKENPEIRPTGVGKIGLRLGLFIGALALSCLLLTVTLGLAYEFRNVGVQAHWNWKSAIRSMRTIHAAQALFLERGSMGRYGSLEELREANYIDEVLGNGQKQGYAFELAQRTVNGDHQFWVKASPQTPVRVQGEVFFLDQRGERFFFINQTGILYQSYSDFEPGFYDSDQVPTELQPRKR